MTLLLQAGPHGGGECEHGAAQAARAQDPGAGEQARAGEDDQDEDGDPDPAPEGARGQDDPRDGRAEAQGGRRPGRGQEDVPPVEVKIVLSSFVEDLFEGIVPLIRKVQMHNTNVLSRDLREEVAGVQSRELELAHKKSDLEKQLELAEAETLTVKNELKVALRRIDDLQAAIGGEMDSDFVSDPVQSHPHL